MTWNDLISPYQSCLVVTEWTTGAPTPTTVGGPYPWYRCAMRCYAVLESRSSARTNSATQIRGQNGHTLRIVPHVTSRYIKYHQVTYFSMAYHGIILLWCNQRQPSNWQMWKALAVRQYNLWNLVVSGQVQGISNCKAALSLTTPMPCNPSIAYSFLIKTLLPLTGHLQV